jgi:TRAP-type mannitol/chloroaromatic compound transport system permease large subunit
MFYSTACVPPRAGPLAVATLIVCTFWGIASGVGAVVVLMGVIAFNPMLRAGYDAASPPPAALILIRSR